MNELCVVSLFLFKEAFFSLQVGDAFDNVLAKEELKTIASDPDTDHVFKVTDFDALNNIIQKLEENIIAIEGMLSPYKTMQLRVKILLYMYRYIFWDN